MPTPPLTIVDHQSDRVKHTRLGKGKQPAITDQAAMSSGSRRDSGTGADVTPGRLHRQSLTLAVLKNRNVGKVEKFVSLFQSLHFKRPGVESPALASRIPVPIVGQLAETSEKEKVQGHKGKQKDGKDVHIAAKHRSKIPRKAAIGRDEQNTRIPTQNHHHEHPTSPQSLASLLRTTTLADLLPPHHHHEVNRVLDDISSSKEPDPSKVRPPPLPRFQHKQS
ncbi:hypothetical protein BDU57DRAFT_516364 [Ampelomyces quisqualis]|uniref:Uncharacterized protein n=1 Tax=Ampelomyces quisqualis TaxID=50730 RepID=A0A6A5QNA3_AMPQU|nr:hypothetical protein BDU57DRAFT_516364 [Ampelomyces quisqualis]